MIMNSLFSTYDLILFTSTNLPSWYPYIAASIGIPSPCLVAASIGIVQLPPPWVCNGSKVYKMFAIALSRMRILNSKKKKKVYKTTGTHGLVGLRCCLPASAPASAIDNRPLILWVQPDYGGGQSITYRWRPECNEKLA